MKVPNWVMFYNKETLLPAHPQSFRQHQETKGKALSKLIFFLFSIYVELAEI